MSRRVSRLDQAPQARRHVIDKPRRLPRAFDILEVGSLFKTPCRPAERELRRVPNIKYGCRSAASILRLQEAA